MQTSKEILAEIRANKDSCHHDSLIREYKGKLYELIDDRMGIELTHVNQYRVILSWYDYDYVKDDELTAELDKVFAE